MLQRLKRYSAALLLVLTPVGTILLPGVAHAAANTCMWTEATDTTMSTATNWTGCGGTAPVAGDVIAFGVLDSSSTTHTLTNDLGVALGGVIYGDGSVGATNTTTYQLSTLALADGAVVTGVNAQGYAYSNASVEVSALSVAGALTLDGYLVPVAGLPGILTVIPTNLTTSVYTNYLAGGSPILFQASGTVTVKKGGLYTTQGTETAITVENGGELLTSDATLTIPVTYGGGSGTANPVLSDNVSVTLSGAQTLLHNIDVNVSGTSTVTITGPLSGAYTVTKSSGATGTLVINSSNNTSNTPNATQATPDTTTTLSDSLPTTTVTIPNHSTTIIDGARGSVLVDSGGTLKGSGTVGTLYVSAGATVAPGHSPGCLNSSNFTVAGTYQAEIGGTDPCTGYDQMKVTGTVDVTGGTLLATRYNNFKPAKDQKYTIIDNDGSDAVTGTFSGLAEGATIKLDNGAVLGISYKGGDGNDVVLTVQNVPATPDTGFGAITAHPAVTLGATLAAAGTLLVLARRMRLAPARAKATRR